MNQQTNQAATAEAFATAGLTPNPATHLPAEAPAQSGMMAPAPARDSGFDLTPKTFDQAVALSKYLANSNLVPKDYQGKEGDCLIAMQWGFEIGLKPMQALQSIAAINGRPTLWGDAMLALVRASGLLEYIIEEPDTDGTAVCTVKRRGEPNEHVVRFGDADANLAGLLNKAGPWKTNPKRMKQLRARAFALRDKFTDVLRGIQSAEEQTDIVEMETGGQSRPAAASTRPTLPVNAKGSQIAEANRPAMTEEGSAALVKLTKVAKTQGSAAFSAMWREQPQDIRAQIGTKKRDELLAEGIAFDNHRKDGATDAKVIGE